MISLPIGFGNLVEVVLFGFSSVNILGFDSMSTLGGLQLVL